MKIKKVRAPYVTRKHILLHYIFFVIGYLRMSGLPKNRLFLLKKKSFVTDVHDFRRKCSATSRTLKVTQSVSASVFYHIQLT